MHMSLRLLFASLLFVGQIWAYDTGHHNDLTRNTLQQHGYNENAQRIAGVANFFVDYFAFSPLPNEKLPELNLMHFDNVFTMKNASNYWTQFTVNSKRAVEAVARNGDPLEFIMTIGGTLHTVQDFYTHSNWVDSHYRTECDCFRPETWIHTLHEINGDYNALLRQHSAIHTYSYGDCNEDSSRNCHEAQLDHGDACGGINKDSYVRPYWEQSYGFAFSASMEWVNNVHQWASAINPDIVNQAKNFKPATQQDSDDLDKLDEYLHTVSYAIKWFDEDGHWKGPGSGSVKRFLPAQAEFTASKSIYKSKYQDAKIHQRWTSPNVYDFADVDQSDVIDVSTITEITTPYTEISQFTPVVVRTVAVRGQDKLNTPSYFATVNIDGMEFVETVYIDNYDFNPHWTSIKFVNATATPSVPIVYQLKDNKYPRSDENVKITNSGSESLNLLFDVATRSLSGDISGIYDNITNTVTTKHDEENVEVELFVTTLRFANCSSGLPQQFCPNEAYVFAGAFDQCSGETIAESGAPTTYVSALFFFASIFSIMVFYL